MFPQMISEASHCITANGKLHITLPTVPSRFCFPTSHREAVTSYKEKASRRKFVSTSARH